MKIVLFSAMLVFDSFTVGEVDLLYDCEADLNCSSDNACKEVFIYY